MVRRLWMSEIEEAPSAAPGIVGWQDHEGEGEGGSYDLASPTSGALSSLSPPPMIRPGTFLPGIMPTLVALAQDRSRTAKLA